MGLFSITVVLAAVVMASVGVVLGIAHLLLRVGYSKTSLAIVAFGAVYLGYTSIAALAGCAEDSVFVPLTGELAGDGYLSHPCDGPGGFASYVYGYLAAPVGVITLGVIAWRRWKTLPMTRQT